MCKLFDEWRNEIKDYCRQQGLNFDTAEKLSQFGIRIRWRCLTVIQAKVQMDFLMILRVRWFC